MDRYSIKRTDREIDEVLNEAGDSVNTGRSKFPGMSYEDGLRAMFDWLTVDEVEYGPLE